MPDVHSTANESPARRFLRLEPMSLMCIMPAIDFEKSSRDAFCSMPRVNSLPSSFASISRNIPICRWRGPLAASTASGVVAFALR